MEQDTTKTEYITVQNVRYKNLLDVNWLLCLVTQLPPWPVPISDLVD